MIIVNESIKFAMKKQKVICVKIIESFQSTIRFINLALQMQLSLPKLVISIQQMASFANYSSRVFNISLMGSIKVKLFLIYHENDVLGIALGTISRR